MSDDYAERINEIPGEGWLRAMGITFTAASRDEVRAEWEVGPVHLQGYGIVHGGVHCGVVESLCSVGAFLSAMERGQRVVGLDNHTSFVRAVRSGRLSAVATPVTRGRTTQVWRCDIRDDQGQMVATGTVRLLCVDPERPLG